MAELVTIPLAAAEYRARFERPYIGFIGHERLRASEAVFTALLPFGLRLSNTEFITAGTPADLKTVFRIPERGVSFEFGAEEYRFNKEPLLLSQAEIENDWQIILAAERALLAGGSVQIVGCIVRVAMHLQLQTKPREELLAPFLPEPFQAFLKQRQIRTYGTQIILDDGDVFLDFSLAYENGIFLRFSSHFHGHPPLDDVQAKVLSDAMF